jgi:hypothetical protein
VVVSIAILVILVLSAVLVVGGQLLVSLRDPHDPDDGIPRRRDDDAPGG